MFDKCLDRHAPIKKIRIHTNYKRRLSKPTYALIRERNFARLRVIRADDRSRRVLAQNYRKARNAVTSRIRKEAISAVREN